MRILITGSRDWDDETLVREALDSFRDHIPKTVQHILVSGGCRTGADLMAEDYARKVGWAVECHPADWGRYGKRAGYVRNKEMVGLGADICMAFILNDSRGATMTVELAVAAGIETRIFERRNNHDHRRLRMDRVRRAGM